MISAVEVTSESVGLATAVATLFGLLVTVTKLLLKEKDSKLQMLREFYEKGKKG